MQPKLTVDNKLWFGTLYFKGMKQLSPESDIRLKISSIFYPLAFPLECLFFIGLLSMALLPMMKPANMPLAPIIIANIILVPGYLLLRHLLIRRKYRLGAGAGCQISRHRIALPGNSLIQEPFGQLTLAREDIKNIEIFYWVRSDSSRTYYSVVECHIALTSGKVLRLKDIYFPLKHMLYLLLYFDYPLTFSKRHWSLSHLLRILLLSFPVVANLAMTGLLVKEYVF